MYRHRYPQRGEPLVFILASRKRQPKWERVRLRGIRMRRVKRVMGSEEWSGEGSESDDEEFSEEENVA